MFAENISTFIVPVEVFQGKLVCVRWRLPSTGPEVTTNSLEKLRGTEKKLNRIKAFSVQFIWDV